MEAFSYEYYVKTAGELLAKVPFRPTVGLVLGSALGSVADLLENPVAISYREIPGFLTSTVDSHAGQLLFGRMAGVDLAVLSGRFHYYEGYSFDQLAAPIRLLKTLGVEKTILTNAAGAINTSYQVGDVMVIRDQIQLMGASPMRGPNLHQFGPRFFDVTQIYPAALRQKALTAASQLGWADQIHQGVYFYASGPNFETPAEIKAMRLLGGDAVGMSTVTEALTAAHCGMPVLGLSLLTNMAAGVLDQPLSGEEVNIAGAAAAGRMAELIYNIVATL